MPKPWSTLVKPWSNMLTVVLSAVLQRLVPGTRWVDLETDRGKPAARLTGAVAAAAVAAQQAHQQHLQQQAAAAAVLVGGSAAAAAAVGSASSSSDGQQQQQQQQGGGYTGRLPGPLDSINEQDHLADLEEYPLGSLMSFDSDTQDNVPEWIRAFAPAYDGVAAAAEAAEAAAAAAAMGLPPPQQQQMKRVGQADTMQDSSKLDAIESGLFEGGAPYKPFCNAMLDSLQPSTAGSSSSSSVWELQDPSVRETASRLQFADWQAAEALSSEHRRHSGDESDKIALQQIQQLYGGSTQAASSSSKAAANAAAAAAAAAAADAAIDEEQWGEEQKRRLIHELHDLEDSVVGPEEVLYQPFCEKMFQKLHPDQPRLRRTVQRRQQQQQQQQQSEQQSDHEGEKAEGM
jgi:hypothetical protein